MKKKQQESIYAIHPAMAMEESSMRNLEKNSGRSLEEWIAIVKKSGIKEEKERAAWLKSEHGLGTNYSVWIATRAAGKTLEYTPEKYVEEMFSGPKAPLRPIYERLLTLGMKLGPDVSVTPCKTIVPIRRKRVIAQIKPSTKTRIDIGFALRELKATGRLIDTGGFQKGDRISHRIPITSLAEIDAEVIGYMKMAYDLDA